MGSDTRAVNARISIKGVENVIVRNLTIVNPCDMNPVWDPMTVPWGTGTRSTTAS